MKIFVSSTIYDLIDVRAELESLLRGMGISPVLSDSATSDFSPCPEKNSIETCLVNLRASDCLVVILSRRYGPSLQKAGFDNVSATHLEYREARSHGMPIRFYVRDRLESDYRIWRRNQGSVELTWVEDPKDYRLFDLMQEHEHLVAKKPGTNWYMPFRHSVELKSLLRRDMALPAAKASLERAIRENHMPIFDCQLNVKANTPTPGMSYASHAFRNVGTVPAYNVSLDWSDKKESEPTPVIAPGSELVQNSFIEYPGFSRAMTLAYYTPDGHKVSDVFQTGINVEGHAIRSGIRLVKRVYKAGTEAPFRIEE